MTGERSTAHAGRGGPQGRRAPRGRPIAGAGLPLALAAGLALWPASGRADVSVHVAVGVPPPPVVVLPAPPPLVVVPGVPLVSYAPSVALDLFRVDRRWYYLHGGHWHVGASYRGPWKHVAVSALPPAILAVPAVYYKAPPGHLKHERKPPGRARGKAKGRHAD